MRQHDSANVLQASGQFVLSPLRNVRSKIQLRRVCPRPEDSQQVRECFFGQDKVATPPDFRFRIPNPERIEGTKWITHSKVEEVEINKNTGETFAVSRHAPSPQDSTQVNNLITQQRKSVSPKLRIPEERLIRQVYHNIKAIVQKIRNTKIHISVVSKVEDKIVQGAATRRDDFALK